jgi:hypothetical protein
VRGASLSQISRILRQRGGERIAPRVATGGVCPGPANGFCVSTGCVPNVGGGSAMVMEATGQDGTCKANPTTDVPRAVERSRPRVRPPSVGGGCSNSQVCVPSSPGNGFIAKACIVQNGAGPCPSGSSYSIQHTFYGSMDDTRGCSPACSCGLANNVQCTSGSVSVYSAYGPMCGGTATDIATDGQCHDFPQTTNIYAMATAPATPVPNTGSYTTSNPQPTGTVTGSMPTTLCCAR